MLRYFLIFSLFIISLSASSQAFLGAAAFGGNLTQVNGDEVYGFKKIGFNLGISAIMPIYKQRIFSSVEISFSQKGSYQKYPFEDDPNKSLPYYNLRLNYLEVPVLIHILDKKVIMAGVGVSYGRLVGLKEIEWGKTMNNAVVGGPYDRDDWNWLVDVRIPIKNRLKFNFRYAYSIKKIRTRLFTYESGATESRDQFNNILTFRVVYVFNEKIVPKEY